MDFLKHDTVGMSEADIAKKLGIENDKLEGLFLAETYHYTANTSDLDILKRPHNNLNAVLNEAWEIDKITNLTPEAEKARDYLMKLPDRLERIATRMKFPEDQYHFKWVDANGRL